MAATARPPLTSYWPIAGADARSLGLFRICLGSLCVYDLVQRAVRMPIHWYLSDDGMITRETVLEVHGSYTDPDLHGSANARLSLYMMAGSTAWIIALYLAHIATAISFIVGYRLELSSAALWLLDMSLFFRAPTLNHSGDMLKRQVLFWAIFCPLDWFSVDERRSNHTTCSAAVTGRSIISTSRRGHDDDDDDDNNEDSDDEKASPANHLRQGSGIFVLVIQIFLVYFANGVFKSGEDWRTDFTATYFALSVDWARRPWIGDWLYPQYSIMKLMTSAVFVAELYGPLLLFVPIHAVRLFITIGLIALQAGLFVMMQHLNVFPLISMTMVVSLLPSWVWDRMIEPCVELLVKRTKQRRHENAARGELAGGVEKEDKDKSDGKHGHSLGAKHDSNEEETAAARPVAGTSSSLSSTTLRRRRRQPQPQGRQGDEHELQARRAPQDQFPPTAVAATSKRRAKPHARSLITHIFIVCTLFYVVLYNLATLEWLPQHWLDAEVVPYVSPNSIGRGLGLDQRWDQYAPIPMRKFRYYAVTGILANGTSVDCVAMLSSRFQGELQPAWTAQMLTLNMKSHSVWSLYNDIRLFYFFLYTDVALQSTGNPIQLKRLLSWICEQWNGSQRSDKQQRLVKITLIGFSFEALDHYQHIGAVPVDNKMFGTHCHKFNNVGMD